VPCESFMMSSIHSYIRSPKLLPHYFVDGLDWIEQGLTSHSTHFRLFRRRWGDCCISQYCSHTSCSLCLCLMSLQGDIVYQ